MNKELWCIDTDKEKLTNERKICLGTTISTKLPTWSCLRLKPDLLGKRPATNRLNHGTANFV